MSRLLEMSAVVQILVAAGVTAVALALTTVSYLTTADWLRPIGVILLSVGTPLLGVAIGRLTRRSPAPRAEIRKE